MRPAPLRYALAPAGVRLDQNGSFPVNPSAEFLPKWQPRWHLTASCEIPSARQEFLIALLPYADGKETTLADTRPVDGTGCRAVEVRTASARHVILFRRAGYDGAMQAGGLSSRAAVLAAGFDLNGRAIGRLEIQ
jgi:hypothetical protein